MNSCCFPNKVLYPRRTAEPRKYYPIGSYFRVENYSGLSRLVLTDYNTVVLVDPKGICHINPIKVTDKYQITDDTIGRLTLFEWEHVPNVEPARAY